jgi:hypothetical protein
MVRRRLTLLLLPLLLVLLAGLLPAPAAAQSGDPACYVAALAALGKQGSIYSQGGHLAADPIDPFTGQHYPRTGPESFDCSGLVWYAYNQAGVDVGWTTQQQITDGQRVSCGLNDLAGSSTTCWAPGDLIFLQYQGGQHVALYTGDGLFMDCYNHDTGCILHAVENNSFYRSHFWQARRVSSGCEDMTLDPGTPYDGNLGGAPPLEYPRFNEIPDLVGYVQFVIPQCNNCNEDGELLVNQLSPAERAEESARRLPSAGDWIEDIKISVPWGEINIPMLNPAAGFQKIFDWLVFWVTQLIYDVICWLLTISQWVANFLAESTNGLFYILNMTWRFALFAWLTVQQWIFSLWSFLGLSRQLFVFLQQAAVWVWAWLVALWDVLLQVLALLGRVVMTVFSIMMMLLGLLGWLGGFALGIIFDILAALRAETLPDQLTSAGGHGVYYMLRGILDAIHDSQLGWLMILAYALANINLIFWLSRFLPSAKE